MPMTAPASTVLMVDDHPIVRRGLATLLGMEPWVARVVEAASVRETQERAVTERPDAAVVDLGLPDGDGLELIGRIRRAVPGCAVVVLTMTREETVVRACMAAGARGYLLKDTAPSVIVNSVRAVLDGVVTIRTRHARGPVTVRTCRRLRRFRGARHREPSSPTRRRGDLATAAQPGTTPRPPGPSRAAESCSCLSR